jgi:hypothetical protein
MKRKLRVLWLLIPVLVLLGIIPLFSQTVPSGYVKIATATTSGTCPSVAPAGSFCYDDTAVVANVTYYYQVYTVDVNGAVSSAAVPAGTLPATFDGSQDYADATANASTIVYVYFTPATVPTGGAAIAGYIIYRYTGPLAATGLQAAN